MSEAPAWKIPPAIPFSAANFETIAKAEAAVEHRDWEAMSEEERDRAIKRVRGFMPVVTSLLVSAISDANQLAGDDFDDLLMEVDCVSIIREMLNSQNVPGAPFIDDHVRNAIAQRNMAVVRAEAAEARLNTIRQEADAAFQEAIDLLNKDAEADVPGTALAVTSLATVQSILKDLFKSDVQTDPHQTVTEAVNAAVIQIRARLHTSLAEWERIAQTAATEAERRSASMVADWLGCMLEHEIAKPTNA